MNNNFEEFIKKIKIDPKNYKELIVLHTYLDNKNEKKAKIIINFIEEKCIDKLEVLQYLLYYYNSLRDNEKHPNILKLLDKNKEIKNNIASNDGTGIFKYIYDSFINYQNYDLAKYAFYIYLDYFSTADQINMTIELVTAYEKSGDYEKALTVLKEFKTHDPYIFNKNLDLKFTYNRISRKHDTGEEFVKSKFPPLLKSTFFKPVFLLPLFLLVIFLFLCGLSLLISLNQKLYIINGFNNAITVQLQSGKILEINPNGNEKISIKEGKINLKIKLNENNEYVDQIKISNGLFERLRDKMVFVYNIKGGAVVIWEETQYSVENSLVDNTKSEKYIPLVKIYTGETLLKFKNIDYVFKDFPETLDLYESQPKIVSRISTVSDNFANQFNLFYYYKVDTKNIFNYLNAHLTNNINNEDFLNIYANFCSINKYNEYAINELEPYLSIRPVSVYAHRIYQELYMMNNETKYEELLNKYNDFIKNEPEDSDLLYLYGRLIKNNVAATDYFNKAILKNQKNPYPYHALAYKYFSEGNFILAKKYSEKALNLNSNILLIKSYYNEICYATGNYNYLIKEIKESLKSNPLNYNNILTLIELYILNDNNDKIQSTIAEYINNYKQAYPEADIDQFLLSIMLNYYTFQGKFNLVLKESDKLNNNEDSIFWKYMANLEIGNFIEVEKYFNNNIDKFNGYEYLLLYLGLLSENNLVKAGHWFNVAISYFNKGTYEDKIIADLLAKKNTDIFDEVINLSTPFFYKKIIFLSLIRLYPQYRSKLILLANKFNYSLYFPHYFIKKISAKL